VRAGQRLREGEQVGAVAATELEHAALGGGRGPQPEQAADRLQPRGVRYGVGAAGIGELLVGTGGAQSLALATTFQLTLGEEPLLAPM
jgi:hypothetical protein